MRQPITLFVLIVSAVVLLPVVGCSQRIDRAAQKLEKYRRENWPPIRAYSRVSLGYALQQKFKLHAQYCGFDIPSGKRDYVPSDINKFLGNRTLRTKVETADIRGGGLMYYIFHDSEMIQPFDVIQYVPSKVLRIADLTEEFAINPDENFDTYILTKTCGGYLKSALDAGIEPPYAAFRAALETDSRRESQIVALSGSFVSPLKLVLDANNDQTVEVLMKIWKFYMDNPDYVGSSHYLKEFEGVMIRHIASTEQNRAIEMEAGVNLNGLLPGRLKTQFGAGATTQGTFSGTDWETIIYADYDEKNMYREDLFAELPSPAFIRRYFENIHPAFQKSRDFPVMTEGITHKHFLTVEGIPENMTENFWEIESVKPGVYEGYPNLEAQYFEDGNVSGCRFTVSGRPLRENFQGAEATRPSRLPLSYTIRSRYPVNGEYLRLYVNEEIQTSAHPVASVGNGEFDLTKKEDRKFAFQWKFEVDIEDNYNPVDFADMPYIGNLTVRRSDKNLNVKLANIEADPQRKRFYITLETFDTYPLDKIDDLNMMPYNLSLDVHLNSKISGSTSVRPLKGILYFPSIKPDPPKDELVAPLQLENSENGMLFPVIKKSGNNQDQGKN